MTLSGDVWVLSGIGFLIVAGGMVPLLSWLRRTALLDIPNKRSSHRLPTPTGAGIAVVGVLIPIWLIVAEQPVAHVVAPAAVLALVSLRDDFQGLSTLVRLIAHGAAVFVVLAFEPGLAATAAILLPEPAAVLVTGLAWVWFINLFNFMDGIDGITGIETICIGLGVAVVIAFGGLSDTAAGGLPVLGLTAAAVASGFLLWNWHPAKVFLGDVGSVPLGFLLGWLLLSLGAAGAWPAAVILPGYYLFDATVTLLGRVVRGQPFWRAHREHFYQRGVVAGLGHNEVSGFVLAGNLVLIGIAAATVGAPGLLGLTLAAPVVIGLVLIFRLGGRGPQH